MPEVAGRLRGFDFYILGPPMLELERKSTMTAHICTNLQSSLVDLAELPGLRVKLKLNMKLNSQSELPPFLVPVVWGPRQQLVLHICTQVLQLY